MATLITAHDGSGRCIGRCDAHCHEAKQERCKCICQGRYHGRGTATVIQEVKDNPTAFSKFLDKLSMDFRAGPTILQETMTL